MKKDTLTIIPSYNEEETVGGVVEDIRKMKLGLDILVIDDGSKDLTRRRAEEAGAKVLSLPSNLGYGSAVEAGYKYALQNGYTYIVQMDADGQHRAEDIPHLLEKVREGIWDVCIGSRFLNKSIHPSVGLVKMIGILISRCLITLSTGEKITDPTSGFQVLTKEAVLFLVEDGYPEKFADADIVIKLCLAGFRVGETPVVMKERSHGKSKYLPDLPAILYYTFKMGFSFLDLLLNGRRFKDWKKRRTN
jgi:hypothetical protein